jgi:GT2 family glycosyltransferase
MVGEWIHIQSDDHIWEPDALIKLLDREVDVIVPIILMRSPPFSTLIFKDLTDEGYMPFSFEEIPEKGMMEVFAAGTGGMTIRKNVLDAIGEPWFKYREGIHLSEDLYLCQRIREAGFKIWCDVEVRMGHRGTHTVYPIYEDGTWAAGLKLGDATNSKLNMISLHPKLEEK